MYTLGEDGGKLNICGLDHSGSETFNYDHIVYNISLTPAQPRLSALHTSVKYVALIMIMRYIALQSTSV